MLIILGSEVNTFFVPVNRPVVPGSTGPSPKQKVFVYVPCSDPKLVMFLSLTEAPLPDPTPTPTPRNAPETDPKRTENGPETDPKRTEIDPKWTEIKLSGVHGTARGFVGMGGGVVREKKITILN